MLKGYMFTWLPLVFCLWNPGCLCYRYSPLKGAKFRDGWRSGAYNPLHAKEVTTQHGFQGNIPSGAHGHDASSLSSEDAVHRPGLEPIVSYVHKILTEAGNVDPNIALDTAARWEYGQKAILESIAAAKEADRELTGNAYEESQGFHFCRFDGDEGIERKIVAKTALKANTDVITMPKHLCFCLSTSKKELADNYNTVRSSEKLGSFEAFYVDHVEKIHRLNIGGFMGNANDLENLDEETPDVSQYTGSDNDENVSLSCNINSEDCGFESRLNDYITLKRLQLFKTLIIADSIMSVGEVVSAALNNKEISVAHINRNERELLLLSTYMAGEYYMALLSAILRFIRNSNSVKGLSKEDKVRLGWTHHLLTKDMGHLPMLMPEASVKQIQEPVVRYRMKQRHMALNDVFRVAQDPLYLIQDRIEGLAQAHYKIEDSMPTESGCGPLMTNRKLNAELALEGIEKELLTLENDSDLKRLSGLFYTSREDILQILGDDLGTNNHSSPPTDQLDTRKFFERYLTDTLTPDMYSDIHLDTWLHALNNSVTMQSYTKLFATIIAHSIRVKGNESFSLDEDYKIRSFLHNGAHGIEVEPENDINVKDSKSEAYIVPLIDTCNNESIDANSHVQMKNRQNFIMWTKNDIAPGQELTINYGTMDNNLLMLDYGILPKIKHDVGVLMEIEPVFIKKAASSREIDYLLPRSFPSGLPLEKRGLLAQFNMIEIPSDKNFLALYNNPYFQGIPVEMYNEYNARFVSKETAKHAWNNEEVPLDMINQETSEYRPVTTDLFTTGQDDSNNPLKLVRVESNGIPDEKLVPVLKILFCKTKKRLQWISEQDTKYLSTSINSPLDVEVFKVASLVCCEFFKNKYQRSIIDDIRFISNPDLGRISEKFKTEPLETMRQCTSAEIPNALLLAHALRSKVPLYRCASYYDNIACDFEQKKKK